MFKRMASDSRNFFLFFFAWLQRSISTNPIGANQQFISQQHTHKSLIAFAMVFSLPSRTLFRLRFPSWFLQVTDFLSEKIRKGTKKYSSASLSFLQKRRRTVSSSSMKGSAFPAEIMSSCGPNFASPGETFAPPWRVGSQSVGTAFRWYKYTNVVRCLRVDECERH